MEKLHFLRAMKYSHICTKCGKILPTGNSGYQDDQQKYYHVGCQPEIKSIPKTKEMRIEESVRRRLRIAKALVAKEFNISEDMINPESMVLYETMRELYGEAWLEEFPKS